MFVFFLYSFSNTMLLDILCDTYLVMIDLLNTIYILHPY
jgi:hypothetical protein